ncbi:MAG TPA: nitroreductase family protein [Polyangiaceae bacterium]|nr:nitroreductase family protein [Polyangiaceae bacterium]
MATRVAFPPKLKARLKRTRSYDVYTSVRPKVENALLVGEIRVLKAVARSGLLASLYYGMLSRRFDREHRAVVEGRIAYLSNISNGASSSPLLRRNTHRLEKGLIMRPRRPVFALDYIAETVDIYEKVLLAAPEGECAANEVVWACDVLTSYFDACGSAPELSRLRERFERLPRPKSTRPDAFQGFERRAPYTRGAMNGHEVTYEALLELARRRRSVRWFQDRPVDRALLDKAFDVARLAPTACNRLPYEFRVMDDPSLAREAAKLAAGTAGYVHQIPTTIVVIGDLSAYFHERDRHLIYIDSSLATMSLLFALESLGLSSCCINWSDISWRERAMTRFLRTLPPYKRPIMLIAVGYADEAAQVPFSSKKELEVLRSYNFEGH